MSDANIQEKLNDIKNILLSDASAMSLQEKANELDDIKDLLLNKVKEQSVLVMSLINLCYANAWDINVHEDF